MGARGRCSCWGGVSGHRLEEEAMGGLMKRFHAHTRTATETQDDERVFGPLKAPGAPTHTHTHTHNWLETSAFFLSSPFSAHRFLSPILPLPHSFAAVSLLSLFPLYLSLTRLIAADFVLFCVAGEIFQYVLWRTMPRHSHE